MINPDTSASCDTVRLFIAAELSQDVKHELIRLQKSLEKSHVLVGTYPQPEAMHLTLKFIGDVHKDRVSEIQRLLHGISHKSLAAQLTVLMFFGNSRAPKILYVDVDCPQLEELVRMTDEVLKDFCEPVEREFKSHLTLVRVRHTIDSEGLLHWIGNTQVNPLPFAIDHFCLMQSKLDSAGPVHSIIERYALTA